MNHYYCGGCNQVITREVETRSSYCATSDRMMTLKPLAEDQAEILKQLLILSSENNRQ